MRVSGFSLLLLTISLVSCIQNQAIEVVQEENIKPIEPATVLVDTDTLESLSLSKADLFGTFYSQDQLSVFIIDTPEEYLYGSKVASTIYTFLGDELIKKKYIIAHDISSEIILNEGTFKIKPLDSTSMVVVKANNILVPNSAYGTVLNPQLSDYRLTWERVDFDLEFTKKSGTTNSFELSKKVKNYDQVMGLLR